MTVTKPRNTEQRFAIRRAVERAAGPLSAPEVLDAAQVEVPAIGIATVYRNLRALAEEGWLRQVDLPGEASRYEVADKHHHHHFHCDQCGRVFDIEGCSAAIERSVPDSFEVDRHELLLYGRCEDCVATC